MLMSMTFEQTKEGNLGSLGPSSLQNTFPIVNKGGLQGTVGSLVGSLVWFCKRQHKQGRGAGNRRFLDGMSFVCNLNSNHVAFVLFVFCFLLFCVCLLLLYTHRQRGGEDKHRSKQFPNRVCCNDTTCRVHTCVS